MSRLLVVLLLVLLGGIPTSAEGPHTKSEGLVPDDGRPRGKVLYNGIRLPDQWPPRTDKLTREPMPVPYLKNPPAIIPINVGRQLFVDDFLIEKTTLQRVFHQPEYYKQNPVLAPETSCEIHYEGHWFAAPFSGGAAFDPRDSLFKLFYRGGFSAICYATSKNGLDWEKPYLDVNPVGLLHHFKCTPSNPKVNDRVTIKAYDKHGKQLDLSKWDIIEFSFLHGRICVQTDHGSIVIDDTGGAVFTVTEAILEDCRTFDFNAYKETGLPRTEVFKLPFPFDTIKRGGNAVYPFSEDDANHMDSTSILMDHNAPPAERFKLFATEFPDESAWLTYRVSPDGIRWSGPKARARVWGDRTTVFYNPFRDVWVCSQRTEDSSGRAARSYVEGTSAADLMSKVTFNELTTVEGESVQWVGADGLDPHHTDPLWAHYEPALYNLDAAPYESIMLGQFSIWQGPSNEECGEHGLQKRNDILLGFSRDGFHWDRPDRTRFVSCTWNQKSWRFANVQSVAGGPLIVGDKLHFYFSARPKPSPEAPDWDTDGRTGLAILRRDGFASMNAGKRTETLTTRLVSFQGKHLFVNVDCPEGQLKAEVLDRTGKVIEPFSLKNCEPISSDTTLVQVNWRQDRNLAALAGKPVRFRFHLRNGSLYAFWVSPDQSGASHGYVGAGGPGFAGPTDTVGQSASLH